MAAGAALWLVDVREHRSRDLTDPTPAPEPEPEHVPAPKAEPEPEPEPAPEPEQAVAPVAEPEPEPEVETEPEPESVPATESDAEPVPEPEPDAEPVPEPAPEPEPEPEPQPESEPEPAPAPAAPVRRAHRKSGLQFPGASRRERRAWAESHGFTFAKHSDDLAGEWQRGAAAAGASPKDIASGFIYGHSTHVMDLGGVTVIAMDTGRISDVVVDMRREGFHADSSADLVAVTEAEGFTVLGTHAGAVERFMDVRVRTALSKLPQTVTAAWFESDWVLAEMDRASAAAEWEDTLAPLALLADAARTLPPETSDPIDFGYITRHTPDESASTPEVPTTLTTASYAEPEEAAAPQVQRPDEPLEMPTRVTGTVRGEVDYSDLGGDEIAPIADGAPDDSESQHPADLTRVRRTQTPSSIFGDAQADAPADKPDTDPDTQPEKEED